MITYDGICKKLGFDVKEYFMQDEKDLPETNRVFGAIVG